MTEAQSDSEQHSMTSKKMPEAARGTETAKKRQEVDYFKLAVERVETGEDEVGRLLLEKVTETFREKPEIARFGSVAGTFRDAQESSKNLDDPAELNKAVVSLRAFHKEIGGEEYKVKIELSEEEISTKENELRNRLNEEYADRSEEERKNLIEESVGRVREAERRRLIRERVGEDINQLPEQFAKHYLKDYLEHTGRVYKLQEQIRSGLPEGIYSSELELSELPDRRIVREAAYELQREGDRAFWARQRILDAIDDDAVREKTEELDDKRLDYEQKTNNPWDSLAPEEKEKRLKDRTNAFVGEMEKTRDTDTAKAFENLDDTEKRKLIEPLLSQEMAVQNALENLIGSVNTEDARDITDEFNRLKEVRLKLKAVIGENYTKAATHKTGFIFELANQKIREVATVSKQKLIEKDEFVQVIEQVVRKAKARGSELSEDLGQRIGKVVDEVRDFDDKTGDVWEQGLGSFERTVGIEAAGEYIGNASEVIRKARNGIGTFFADSRQNFDRATIDLRRQRAESMHNFTIWKDTRLKAQAELAKRNVSVRARGLIGRLTGALREDDEEKFEMKKRIVKTGLPYSPAVERLNRLRSGEIEERRKNNANMNQFLEEVDKFVDEVVIPQETQLETSETEKEPAGTSEKTTQVGKEKIKSREVKEREKKTERKSELWRTREDRAETLIEQKQKAEDLEKIGPENFLDKVDELSREVAEKSRKHLEEVKQESRDQLIETVDDFRDNFTAFRLLSVPENELKGAHKDFVVITRHLDHLAAEIATAELPRRRKELGNELDRVMKRREAILERVKKEGLLKGEYKIPEKEEEEVEEVLRPNLIDQEVYKVTDNKGNEELYMASVGKTDDVIEGRVELVNESGEVLEESEVVEKIGTEDEVQDWLNKKRAWFTTEAELLESTIETGYEFVWNEKNGKWELGRKKDKGKRVEPRESEETKESKEGGETLPFGYKITLENGTKFNLRFWFKDGKMYRASFDDEFKLGEAREVEGVTDVQGLQKKIAETMKIYRDGNAEITQVEYDDLPEDVRKKYPESRVPRPEKKKKDKERGSAEKEVQGSEPEDEEKKASEIIEDYTIRGASGDVVNRVRYTYKENTTPRVQMVFLTADGEVDPDRRPISYGRKENGKYVDVKNETQAREVIRQRVKAYDEQKDLSTERLDLDIEVGGEKEEEINRIQIRSGTKADWLRHPDKNEDAHFVINEKLAFGLFDGMGGHASGEVASRLASETVQEVLNKGVVPGMSLEEAKILVENALLESHRKVWDKAKEDNTKMGTTGVAGFVWEGEHGERVLVVGNVGDSRVYRLREGRLQQMTIDDGGQLLAEAENQGWDDTKIREVQSRLNNTFNADELPEDEEDIFNNRNKMRYAIGRGIKPTIYGIDLLPGDRILVCSDGISDNLTDSNPNDPDNMEKILSEVVDDQDAINKLIDASVARSGEFRKRLTKFGDRPKPDDMTALVFTIPEPEKVGNEKVTRGKKEKEEGEVGEDKKETGEKAMHTWEIKVGGGTIRFWIDKESESLKAAKVEDNGEVEEGNVYNQQLKPSSNAEMIAEAQQLVNRFVFQLRKEGSNVDEVKGFESLENAQEEMKSGEPQEGKKGKEKKVETKEKERKLSDPIELDKWMKYAFLEIETKEGDKKTMLYNTNVKGVSRRREVIKDEDDNYRFDINSLEKLSEDPDAKLEDLIEDDIKKHEEDWVEYSPADTSLENKETEQTAPKESEANAEDNAENKERVPFGIEVEFPEGKKRYIRFWYNGKTMMRASAENEKELGEYFEVEGVTNREEFGEKVKEIINNYRESGVKVEPIDLKEFPTDLREEFSEEEEVKRGQAENVEEPELQGENAEEPTEEAQNEELESSVESDKDKIKFANIESPYKRGLLIRKDGEEDQRVVYWFDVETESLKFAQADKGYTMGKSEIRSIPKDKVTNIKEAESLVLKYIQDLEKSGLTVVTDIVDKDTEKVIEDFKLSGDTSWGEVETTRDDKNKFGFEEKEDEEINATDREILMGVIDPWQKSLYAHNNFLNAKISTANGLEEDNRFRSIQEHNEVLRQLAADIKDADQENNFATMQRKLKLYELNIRYKYDDILELMRRGAIK